nr:hypothetical protein [Tanacetum cinerariifolium]
MILESVENGPLLWPSIEENEVTRPKKYFELSVTKAIQADCDVKATNIILQGLPTEERDCKLYDEFDKFSYKKGESLHPLALVATHQMTQSPYQTHQHSYQHAQFQPQVPSFQSSQYGSPYQSSQYGSHTQSLTSLSITYPPNDFQSSIHHNVYNPSSSIPQVEYAPSVNQQSNFSQPDSGLVVLVFQKGDDPIDAINHMMSFLTAELERYKDQVKILKEGNNNSINSEEPNLSTRPTQVENPKELPKVIMAKTSLKKLKHHLASFDVVVKERTTAITITEGTSNLPTSASGSQPSGNTKKNKILQTPSSAKKNKLEAYLRNVRTSLQNKKNVVYTKNIASVPESKLNVNSDLQCVTCNGCLFFDNHDSYVLEFINSVNARVKSKSAKKSLKRKVVQIVLWYLDSGCSKHMTGDRSQLTNFVNKFLGTVKFGNDHVAKIMGYGDYKIGNVTISNVYFVEGLGHSLFSVGQFCDSDLEVAFRLVRGLSKLKFKKDNLCSACAMSKSKKKSHKPKSEDTNQEKLYLLHMDLCGPMRVESVNEKKYILFIVDDYSRFTWVKCLRSKDEAPDFIIKFLKMIQVGISHETLVARSPQQNGVIERRNRTLIEAARTMLIYAQALLFLWAEAVATACYTQNRFIVRLLHGKKPYELLHEKLPDLSFLYVFGAFCYPTNDNENLGKLQLKADIAMTSEQSSSGPTLHKMTPVTISSGLVPKPTSSTPFVPPVRNDWDLLFQPLFDELFTPPPSVDLPAHEVIAPIAEVIALEPAESTGSPSSTTIDQDAPSQIAHMGNDPLFGMPILEVASDQSSSTESIHTIVHPDHQISQHNSKWTKDHPLKNIIDQLDRPVSTRLQLHEQALLYYYDAFLTFVEPKTYKEALTQCYWIEAIQEELNEFERLEVWELVPRPDKVMVITLKWIYKVKLDELGEAVATACYTYNRSIIRLRHGKTPYDILHDKLPGLIIFPCICLEPAHYEITPITISLGLLPNPPPSTPYVPPSRTDWDILFKPLFDKLLTPLPSVDLLAPEVVALIAEEVAPEPAASTGSPSSTTVDQDAPSPSYSYTSPETQSLVISNDVEEENHDLDVPLMNNDPFFGISTPENVSEASSSSDVIPTVMHTTAYNSVNVNK